MFDLMQYSNHATTTAAAPPGDLLSQGEFLLLTAAFGSLVTALLVTATLF